MSHAQGDTPRPSMFVATLHLASLSALVIAYPLYSFLAANPAYFLANDIWPRTIYAMTALVSFGIPFALTVTLLPAGMFREMLFKNVYLILIAILIALSFIPLLGRIQILPPTISIPIAIILAALAARQIPATRFISIGLLLMSPLTFIFPIHFLRTPDMQKILSSQSAVRSETPIVTLENTPPIVMIVFDEFPLIDLLDAEGDIDHKRFPNFAEFARQSTWYENATTVHDYTLKAVPAILTGNYPPSSAVLPLYQNYPQSLFNILSNEYAIHALEQATSLSPSDPQRKHWRQNNATLTLFAGDLAVMYFNAVLPASLAQKWFPIDEGLWGGFLGQSESLDKKTRLKHGEPERARGWRMDRMGDWDRAERLEPINQYISAIDDFPNQTFHFMHILLPHYPFQHLPSGRLYNFDQWPVPSNHTPNALPDSQPYIDQRRHAHLLQVGLVDTILGQLTQTLKTNSLYDESLIVLVSDHGIAFKEGVDGRILSTENIASVGFVPLFIKYPDQKIGIVDSTNVQTIDIAPTILDVLDAADTAPTDGRSLLDENSIPVIKKLTNRHGSTFEYKESEYLELRSSEHNDYIQHFSLDNPNATLYQRGPGLNYLGLSIDTLKDIAITAVIECPGLQDLSSIDPQANYIPLLLTGTVSCPTENNPENLIVAITINGTVEAVTQPFNARNSMLFTMLVSEEDLLNTKNDLNIIILPSNHESL